MENLNAAGTIVAMTPAQEAPGRPEPVERFQPTSGRFIGYAGLVVIAGLLVFLVVSEHTVAGLRIGAGLLFAAVLVWATQLRPRAVAYRDTVLLRNSFRDALVPLAVVDDVSVRRMLNVWVGERRYVCIGIGSSLRKMVKSRSRGPSTILGWDKLERYTEESTPLRPDQTAMDYATFVETRLQALVDEAKRRTSPEDAAVEQPRETWAWPEIAGLVATGLALVVTLLL